MVGFTWESQVITLLFYNLPEPVAYHLGFLDMTLVNLISSLLTLDFLTSTFKLKMKWWLFCCSKLDMTPS